MIEDDIRQAFNQRLLDIHCAVWGRNFQLHHQDHRDRAIDYILSFVEPALEAANLQIIHKPIIPNAYVWQYDRNRNEENDNRPARSLDQVDSTNGTTGEGRLFQNGIC